MCEMCCVYLMQLELIRCEGLTPHDVTSGCGLNQFGGAVTFKRRRHRDKVGVK